MKITNRLLLVKFLLVFVLLVDTQSVLADTLRPGEKLLPNSIVSSANREYHLALQSDGNLVLYHSGAPVWWSGTVGAAVKLAVMQPDGNFVIYDVNNNPVWNTGTAGKPGSFLNVQDDGNIVIYTPTPSWNILGGATSGGAPNPEVTPLPSIQEVCASSPIPNGFIVIGGKYSPATCGQPTAIYENVLYIQRYSTMPVGDYLDVCSSSPTPSGWVITGYRTSYSECGYPNATSDNKKTIKRLS